MCCRLVTMMVLLLPAARSCHGLGRGRSLLHSAVQCCVTVLVAYSSQATSDNTLTR